MATISEKILAAASGRERVQPGEVVTARVDLALTHEACARVIGPFEQMGAERVWDPDRVVIALDHWSPAPTEKAAALHRKIRGFAARHGLRNLYDVGHGISHQVVSEEGFLRPGQLVVGTDSHTNMLGAFGTFSTGIGPTEMAAVFALGRLWLKVPHTLAVGLEGRPGRRVVGKDVILRIIGTLGSEAAAYRTVEFRGPGVGHVSISERMTMCNMTAEMGAKAGIVPPDDRTMRYLSADRYIDPAVLTSDEDAVFEKEFQLSLPDVEPCVARPGRVDDVVPASGLGRVKVDQAYLGSCTNGRLEDLRAAAEVLKGQEVSRGVRLMVSPASRNVLRQALAEGIVESLLDSGAVFCAPGCGACFGGHSGLVSGGETCISTSNRNFVGRMGSRDAGIYLASPYTVAASALCGCITDPRDV